MDARQYRELYLQSAHWKRVREKTLELNRHSCQICGSSERLEVHHITYVNLYRETSEDLACLCHECHDAVHKYMDNHRFYRKPIRNGIDHWDDIRRRKRDDHRIFEKAAFNRHKELKLYEQDFSEEV